MKQISRRKMCLLCVHLHLSKNFIIREIIVYFIAAVLRKEQFIKKTPEQYLEKVV